MKKVGLKAIWSWGSASLGLLALLIQFQNCAPAGSVNTGETADGVRVIDDWNAKGLVFPESLVQLHDATESFVAQGLCDRKDESQINWVLFDDAKSVMTGSTNCEMGGFQVELPRIGRLKCGAEFVLQVFNEQGQDARTIISRKCAPLMAQQSLSNKAEDEACYLELDRSPYSMEPLCYQACYIGERLAFRENVERNRCGTQIGG